jgi:hypothetical protein
MSICLAILQTACALQQRSSTQTDTKWATYAYELIYFMGIQNRMYINQGQRILSYSYQCLCDLSYGSFRSFFGFRVSFIISPYSTTAVSLDMMKHQAAHCHILLDLHVRGSIYHATHRRVWNYLLVRFHHIIIFCKYS